MIATLLLAACAHRSPEPEMNAADAFPPAPEVGPASAWEPPVPEVVRLSDDGPTLWFLPRPGVPLVSVVLVVPGGSATDPADHPGLAALADTMLLHGAGDRDATAFAEAAERLAIDLDVLTRPRATLVTMDATAERLEDGLDLLADAVLRPRFDADEAERARAIRLSGIRQALDDPERVAARVSTWWIYGEDHPLGHPPQGTTWGIEGLDAAALRASWEARASGGGRAVFVVAGDVGRDEIVEALRARFGAWTGEPELPELPPPAPLEAGPRLGFVDNPGSAQSVLFVAMPGWAATDPQAPAARLGVIALGGTFTSRLNRLLREEKGYTYGARARLHAHADHGLVVATTAVQRDVTGPALADLVSELRRVREGVEAEEVTKAVGALRTRLVGRLEPRAGMAMAYADLAAEGLGPEALRDLLAAAREADEAAVDAAMERLEFDRAAVLVVGDAARVREAVERALPGEWRELPRERPRP